MVVGIVPGDAEEAGDPAEEAHRRRYLRFGEKAAGDPTVVERECQWLADTTEMGMRCRLILIS